MDKHKLERIEHKLEVGIEEVIILFIILIELLDFFRIIPPELEFIEKTLAIIAFSYLFFKASMTSIIFGHKKRWADGLIVVSYVLLSLKTIMGFVITASREHSALSAAYSFMLTNIDLIEKLSFKGGTIILALISIYMVGERIGKPSFMYIIHEDRLPKKLWQKMAHFLTIYLSFLAFFVLVFTLAIEWLATTVDAPILVLVILIILSAMIKNKKRMDAESLLYNISDSAENFYEKVILMFKTKSKIAIGIIGILVLHIIVEVGHFIIPYTTGLALPWYFPQLGAGHEPVIVPMIRDFALATGALHQFFVVLVYLTNIVAILMLFTAPAFLWYYLYKDKKIEPGHLTWIFFGVISVFFIAPVFRMQTLSSKLLIGADIITQQIPFIQNVFYAILIGVIVSLIFMALNHRYPKRTAKVAFFTALIYFASYLLYFVTDLWRYYVDAIIIMFQNDQYLIGSHLFIFFTITILFYIGGFVFLIYEVYAKQRL